MKTVVLVATTLSLTTSSFAIEAQSGDAFRKVMSINRFNKHIAGSNYVSIKNNDDLEKYGKKDLGLTVDATKKNVGVIYNVVEVENIKSKKYKNKIKGKNTNKYNKKNQKEEHNYGVKVKTKKGFNRGFKGKIINMVKIKNSELPN